MTVINTARATAFLILLAASYGCADDLGPPPKQATAGAGNVSSGSGGAMTGSGGASAAAGTGGASVGMGGSGAMVGAGGSSASAGMGGSNPSGGTGSVSTGGTGGMEPTEDLTLVTAGLDGQTILTPCARNTSTRVCTPTQVNTGCTANPGDPALSGGWSHAQTVTLGGTPGVFYDVTLRIQGLVEAKTYQNGMDVDNSGTQIPANGLYIGGTPNNNANAYNIYMIRTSSPSEDYFLNSVGAGQDNRVRHSVFTMDYTFTMRVEGGSTVLLQSSDPNCSAIKNCAEPDVSSQCNPVTYNAQTAPGSGGLDPKIADDIGDQPYNGQFIGVLVTNIARVE